MHHWNPLSLSDAPNWINCFSLACQLSSTVAHVKSFSTEHDGSQKCTAHVCTRQLSSYSQSEDLQKHRIATTWASDEFCSSQKPTLDASHAHSPCVLAKHWETEDRTVDELCCCPQSMREAEHSERLILLLFVFSSSTFLQWKSDQESREKEKWMCTLTGRLPGEGDL